MAECGRPAQQSQKPGALEFTGADVARGRELYYAAGLARDAAVAQMP